MKVLLLNDVGTPSGGAEIATLRLRDGLRARGHDALLLASSASGVDMPSGADVACHGTTSRWRTLLQTANWPARRTLDRVLTDFRPDVVHVGMFLTQLSPLILPALRDFPTVYYAHWLRAICPTGFKQLPDGTLCTLRAGRVCHQAGCIPLRDWGPLMVQRQLLDRWRGAFDRVVTNSEAAKRALMSEGYRDVSVIPLGVPEAAFVERVALADVPTVVCCGRLTRQKGVHVLLEAWSRVVEVLPAARLLVIGDGPERPALEAVAPPSVRFLGHLSLEALQRVAQPAWVHVVPSLAFEPFGMTAAEAMMRGTAVVGSQVGGLPEVVLDGVTGRLVPPNDSAPLAAALTSLLGDRELCMTLGARGRERAQSHFSESGYVGRFVELFESLLASRRAA